MSQSSKDRQIQSLERRLHSERANHRAAINAKTRQLEALRNSWELFATFPALSDLLSWLYKLHSAAMPLRSPTGDGKTTGALTHAETGIYPNADRSRVRYVNGRLNKLSEDIRERLGPRGPLEDSELSGLNRNQCWNPSCPALAWFQPFDLDKCGSCDDPFGTHKPLDDKTKAAHLRCNVKTCPHKNKTNQCEHSWAKISEMEAHRKSHIEQQEET